MKNWTSISLENNHRGSGNFHAFAELKTVLPIQFFIFQAFEELKQFGFLNNRNSQIIAWSLPNFCSISENRQSMPLIQRSHVPLSKAAFSSLAIFYRSNEKLRILNKLFLLLVLIPICDLKLGFKCLYNQLGKSSLIIPMWNVLKRYGLVQCLAQNANQTPSPQITGASLRRARSKARDEQLGGWLTTCFPVSNWLYAPNYPQTH